MTTTTATVTVNADGTAVLDLADGQPLPLHADTVDEARKQSIAMVMGHAKRTGQAVTVLARDPDAEHLLEILPDGTVRPASIPATPPVTSAFEPPDPDPAHICAPQTPPGAEGPTDPVPPAAATPSPASVGPAPQPAQPRTAVALLPPELPATPVVSTRWQVWSLAAVGAVGLSAAVALWLWSHGSTAPTMSTAPTASAASNADTAPTVTLDASTLGASSETRSKAPRPAPLPGTVTPVTWDRAAAWQALRLARQQARQSRQPWTPATAASGPATPAPAHAPAPVYRAPTTPTPAAPAPARPRTQNPVTIYPDPIIQPDSQ